MITLASGDTLAAKAGTASVITLSMKVDAITPATAVNSFYTPQAVLNSGTTTVYTSTGVQTIIREMSMVNTSGSDVAGVTFYLNTNLASTQLTSGFTIPANGMATYSNGQLLIYNSLGYPLATASAITLTGEVTGSGSVSIATTMRASTSSLSGSMSALDKAKLDNTYYDATANSISNISQANTGAANTAAFNTLYAALPVNATVFIPAGTYNFNGDLTINRNIQAKFFGAGKSRTILNNQSTTAHIFNISISAYYYTFEEFGFAASVTKTAGAAIVATGDNAYLDVRRCEFKNQFISMDLSGVGAANVGTISECLMNTPAANGFQMRLNGANINTMITNCTINVTGVAAIGMEINQCGAVQVVGTEFIGGTNALRMNATGVLSAVFFTNCFFDQSTLGSTVKMLGTFATSRIKFVQCGITTGAANLSALEIAGTGSGTGIPEALDFVNCDFYNNSFTGTTNGVLVTGARGVAFYNCRVSGFTNGFNLTPYSAAGVTSFSIQGCKIGPTENFSGNAVGILINAGSFTYGPSLIANNDLSGNTTAAIQNNGTYSVPLSISGNQGLAVAANPLVTTPSTITTAETIVHQVPLPVNSLLVGTTIRFFVSGIITGTTPAIVAKIRLGTLGTATGDAIVCQNAASVMTNNTGWQVEGFLTIRTVGAGTAVGQVRTLGEALATANRVSPQTATTAVTTTSANFATLTLIGSGTTPVMTVVQAYSVIERQ